MHTNSLNTNSLNTNSLNTNSQTQELPAIASRKKTRFEPMLLLVIGIPALTILGGIYTMYLAFNGPQELSPTKVEPSFKGVPLR